MPARGPVRIHPDSIKCTPHLDAQRLASSILCS